MTVTFPDLGFHLGVLNALLDRSIEASALEALVHSTGPDGPEDGYPGPGPRLDASLKLLHAVAITPADAATVEHLDFDGGNDIYMLIEQALDIDTGGESDHYNVNSLEGVQALAGLRSLDLDGHGYHVRPLDLAPLAGHPTLAEVALSGECTASAALESLPALRTLDLRLAKVDDHEAVARLEARGVTVHRSARR